ncbi:MAG: hypothetical protein IJD52_04315 [Alphaproteobacteria bacterium]|nr:hypothetical protein [Alphaproteobacteria bacterium]
MGNFTQAKQTNIARCDGCEYRCALGAFNSNGAYYYYPTIDGQVIYKYINENGAICDVSAYIEGLNSRNRAISLARDIAKCCDRYRVCFNKAQLQK